MRVPVIFSFLSALLGGLSTAAAPRVIVLYPEQLFPELTPILQSALDYSPELEAHAEMVEERRGNALAQSANARSRVDAFGTLMTGYEMRYNPDGNRDFIDTFEDRMVADLNASVWWRKPLVAWGNNARTERMAELSVEAGESDFAQASREHLTRVRETFLRWSAARARFQLATQNIAAAEQFVEGQRRLFERGETSELAVLELEARLQAAEEVRATAVREETFNRYQLQLHVGSAEWTEALDFEALPDFSLLSIEELQTLRRELLEGDYNSPVVRREERSAAADQTHYDIVSREMRPTVDLIAGLRSDRIDSYNINESSYRLTSLVGFQVRWTIWDGKRNEGQRMAALARRRAREARIEATIGRLRSEAERTFADLELNVRQATTRATRVEMLERRLALANDPGGRDFVAPFDRLELQLNLLEAQNRVLDAKMDYLMNMARLGALFFVDPVSGL